MRKLLLLAAYFILTPCVLIASILLLAWHTYGKEQAGLFSFSPTQEIPVAYTALPMTTQQVSATITTADSRVGRLVHFFQKYNSVLDKEELVQRIVDDADAYHIDYTLVPAIAMQESQGCKLIPKGSENNCWGLGIYTHHNQPYTSLEEGIDASSKTLAKFKNTGLITLEQIGSKWNPNNTNDWILKVNYFIGQIQNQPIIAYLTNL